jgi:hypothetical protein
MEVSVLLLAASAASRDMLEATGEGRRRSDPRRNEKSEKRSGGDEQKRTE